MVEIWVESVRRWNSLISGIQLLILLLKVGVGITNHLVQMLVTTI